LKSSKKSLHDPPHPLFSKGVRGGILFPEQRKQQCQDDTDEDGGGDGEIKSELLLFNDYVSGKSAYPRDFLSQEQKKTHQNNKDTQKDEKLSQSTKAQRQYSCLSSIVRRLSQ